MIRLSSAPSGRIKVTFPYSPGIVAKLRTIKTSQWRPEGKYWSFPHSKPALNEVLSGLVGEDIDIHSSLRTLLAAFVTVLRHISWRRTTTLEPSRSCWVTRMSRPL